MNYAKLSLILVTTVGIIGCVSFVSHMWFESQKESLKQDYVLERQRLCFDRGDKYKLEHVTDSVRFKYLPEEDVCVSELAVSGVSGVSFFITDLFDAGKTINYLSWQYDGGINESECVEYTRSAVYYFGEDISNCEYFLSGQENS